MTVIEKSREIKVAGEYDVVVVGGGIAGVSAALASARGGKKTLLLEKMYMLGGLATAGLVTIYLALCDGNGHQVSYGIAEELLRLSAKHGLEDKHKNARAWLEEYNIDDRKGLYNRFETQFNANVMAILCEQILLENGVEILYGTSLSSAIVEDGRITSVVVENQNGRQAYRARSFIDASGDANLCQAAGATTVEYTKGNTLTPWYYEFNKGEYKLHPIDWYAKPEDAEGLDFTVKHNAMDAEAVSKFMCMYHRHILKHFLSHGDVDKNHAMTTMATFPQLRMSRRLDGRYVMSESEVFKRFDDSVGLVCDWRKPGPVFEVPYGILCSREIKNLAACGRCISVEEDMWDITRVIPACAVTGEAVGVAATFGCDFDDVDIISLQHKLRRGDVRIHIDETTVEIPEDANYR